MTRTKLLQVDSIDHYLFRFTVKTVTLVIAWASVTASAQSIRFQLPTAPISQFDVWESSVTSKKSLTDNPFVGASLHAIFVVGTDTIPVEGFCDSPDGRLFRLRFMPLRAGQYSYVLSFSVAKGKPQLTRGQFTVAASTRPGPLRVDSQHPWHFVREGSGEHFFWNSTTTYWLMGWKDERIIQQALDRLARLRINRIRVAINARQDDGKRWAEPLVKASEQFTFKLNPWVARQPDDLDNPGFDVTRFNVAHWQKLDRLVQYARQKGIIVSLIFYVDGLEHGCDPFKKATMGNADEQRYYRYAAARYSAYDNIMWDIANEYHLFRNEAWVEKMGTLLKQADPAKHLISVHGKADFPFRKSPWVDVVLYQSWDECGGYQFMTDCRQKQMEAGRIMPQVNEEYGYEDHYPVWGCGPTATKVPNGRSADNRRRLAWEIYMAGGYQSTGERANEGTGAGHDTGGGWINGRGDSTMTMLTGYGYIMDSFQQVTYWQMEPHNELTNYGNLCLAEPGQQYLVYSRLTDCRVALPRTSGTYSVLMLNPRTGEQHPLPDCDASANGAWQYPKSLVDDWVFILKKK
ncbi:DUF4038 domain-containing protein [Spirosoma soli]|uniref:DUF4038 domain-containing protein n=1 Tax=Spirosoma soli TaxID=1770529 RepID=A0ABW5MDH9_9BACT